MTGSMRTNKETRGKFRVSVQEKVNRMTRREVEDYAMQKVYAAIDKGLDNDFARWTNLEDHMALEIKLSPRYLVRIDKYPEAPGFTYYADLYDFDDGNRPPETIAEIRR